MPTSMVSKFFYILGDHKKRLPFLMTLFFINSMIDLVGISLLASYVLVIDSPGRLMEIAFIADTFKYFELGFLIEQNVATYTVGVILVSVFLVKVFLALAVQKLIYKFSFSHNCSLIDRLMNSFQQMPYTVHLNRNSSSIIETIYVYSYQFTSSCLVSVLQIFSSTLIAISILALLVYTSPLATAVIGGLILVIFFLYDFFFKSEIQKKGKVMGESTANLIARINQGIKGLQVIRIFGKEKYFHREVTDNAWTYANNLASFHTLSLIPRLLMELVVVLFVVCFASFYIYQSYDPTKIIPILGMFVAAAVRLVPSASQIVAAFGTLRLSTHAVNRIYDDLSFISNQVPASISEKQEAEIGKFNLIEFKQVSVKYPNTEAKALNNISLSFSKGQSIGVIGSSGSGKTTLINTILGFIPPTSGKIRINNENLDSEDKIRAWQKLTAYIPQDVFIIDDTLKSNIALGVPDDEIDLAKLDLSIKQAHLSSVVQGLDQGVNTLIGENGIRFSGGQKQRIALARAFYFDREFIVMDEATAALDNSTEKLIVDEINDLKGDKTLIIIAHRISTLSECDLIYELENGEIESVNTYAQVVLKNQIKMENLATSKLRS